MNHEGRTDSHAFLQSALDDPSGYTIADLFERTCDKYPENTALIYVGCENYPESRLSFKGLDEKSNQIAHSFHQKRQKGEIDVLECVGLFMQNCIEYVILWLGLCKAGIKVAFVNSSINGEALVHSLRICKAKVLVYGPEMILSLKDVRKKIENEMNVEMISVSAGLTEIIGSASEEHHLKRLDRVVRAGIKFTDVFGYVYTSGTTGLPKAVNVTHLKQWNFARGYSSLGLSSNDVVYSSGMPIYHSSATGIGFGMVFHYGATQVIRKKFSASAWLADVIKYKATVVQYIGEICRYIMNNLRNNVSTQHLLKVSKDNNTFNIRLAAGNGLTKEIWPEFQKSFKIDLISEFYGSTEGNGAFRNVVKLENILKGDYSGVGCIGKVNPDLFAQVKTKFRLVKYDVENNTLIKKNGKLIDCRFGEPGECLFAMIQGRASSKFVGYTDEASTKKKYVKDNGVVYVRTGDLLSVDDDGWIRFIDRVGDTFRWRGENVSTAEVASQLSRCSHLAEVNVYGVKLPFVEGRAGCAAVVIHELVIQNQSVESILENILEHARKSLPSYAIPIFIRIQNNVAITGTMKHQKVRFRNEGINVTMFSDPMYWLHPETKQYKRFTQTEYKLLHKGQGLTSRL